MSEYTKSHMTTTSPENHKGCAHTYTQQTIFIHTSDTSNTKTLSQAHTTLKHEIICFLGLNNIVLNLKLLFLTFTEK
jgi:hypothetical protein